MHDTKLVHKSVNNILFAKKLTNKYIKNRDDSRPIKKVLKQAGVVHTILNRNRTIKIVISILCKQIHSGYVTI